jgi:hypothetical protein
MKFRPHRELLEDAMKEMVEVDGLAGLIEHLRRDHEYMREMSPDAWRVFDPPKVIVKPYGSGRDDHIGWKDVHIVLVEGWGPVGFCEGNGL